MESVANLVPGSAASPRPIERRERLSPREFRRDYLRHNRPVIVSGSFDQCPARREWTQESLLDRYRNTPVNVIRWRPQSIDDLSDSEIVEMTLGEYFDLLAHPEKWVTPRRPPYCEWFRAFHRSPELADEILSPAFLPNWFQTIGRSADVVYNWKNLLISPPGAVYNLHWDDLAVSSVVMQFAGTKRFTAFPPAETENIYRGRADPYAPDYEKFPKLARVKECYEAILQPGDAMFTPHYWWHQTETIEPSVSVVIHAVNRQNIVDFTVEGIHRFMWEHVVRKRRRG